MTIRDLNLFSEFGARLQMDESIELTIQSMQAYGQAHDHWVIAWSGGKDSTATLTLIVWLITAGKFRLAPWILAHFPAHRIYVEPFGGAAGVLIQKPRAYSEVYNDLDGDLVNFFRVVQNAGLRQQLVEACVLTPYARAEFDLACQRARPAVQLAMDLARA